MKQKVFKCREGCYHKLKRDFYGKEKLAIRKPGRPLVLDDHFIENNSDIIEIVTVWDDRCPADEYMDDHLMDDEDVWKEVKRGMENAWNWKEFYAPFMEMTKKIELKKETIDSKTLKTHYELLDTFLKAKFPEKEGQSLMDFAWRWIRKLDNVEIMDEDEIVERIIFKLPLDARMRMVFHRPNTKYGLLYRLNEFVPNKNDEMIRGILEEKKK